MSIIILIILCSLYVNVLQELTIHIDLYMRVIFDKRHIVFFDFNFFASNINSTYLRIIALKQSWSNFIMITNIVIKSWVLAQIYKSQSTIVLQSFTQSLKLICCCIFQSIMSKYQFLQEFIFSNTSKESLQHLPA